MAVVAARGHMRLTQGALIQGLELVSCAASKCGPDTQFWGEIADSGSWDRRAGSCSRRRILLEISDSPPGLAGTCDSQGPAREGRSLGPRR